MTRHFLVRAGTALVIFVVVVWALLSFGPAGFVGEPSRSYAAIVGSAIGSALYALFNVFPPLVNALWGLCVLGQSVVPMRRIMEMSEGRQEVKAAVL